MTTMTQRKRTEYRIVDTTAGVVVARGLKCEMMKLIKKLGPECVLYFQGIAIKVGEARL